MAVAKKSIEDLERAVSSAKAALAASEAALAELAVASEPTADLALEERRVGELAIKRGALERVIIAQRKNVEEAAAGLMAAKGPILRQQLREVETAAEGKIAAAVALLWDAYHATDDVRQIHGETSRVLTAMGEAGAAHAREPVRQLDEIRFAVGGLLESLKVAVRSSGMMGIELKPALTAAERAERAQRQAALAESEKRRHAALKLRDQLFTRTHEAEFE